MLRRPRASPSVAGPISTICSRATGCIPEDFKNEGAPGNRKVSDADEDELGPETAGDVILETRSLVKAFKGFVAVDGGVARRCGTRRNSRADRPERCRQDDFLQPAHAQVPATGLTGEIFYRGENITREKPADIARRGIVRSFQICAVFPHLTVLEETCGWHLRSGVFLDLVSFPGARKRAWRASMAKPCGS